MKEPFYKHEDKKNTLNLQHLRNQNLYFEIVLWLDTPKTKKIISLVGFLTQIQYGWQQKRPYIFFYYKPIYLSLLEVLKRYGYIDGWRVVSSRRIQEFVPYSFNKDVIIIFFNEEPLINGHTGSLKILSKKSSIFLTYHQVEYIAKSTTKTFVLFTNKGLLEHNEALKQRIGGILFCYI